MDTKTEVESTPALLDSPTKVRLMIYRYLWDHTERTVGIGLSSNRQWVGTRCHSMKRIGRSPHSAPTLMRACKALNTEVRDLVFSSTNSKSTPGTDTTAVLPIFSTRLLTVHSNSAHITKNGGSVSWPR
jgi:hypothetical protein